MSSRSLFWLLNVVGGTAVLGSYAWGFVRHPQKMPLMWGGVETAWRPFYVVGMCLAAFGYLAMAALIQHVSDNITDRTWSAILWPLLLILIPSALWLPLTLRYAEQPAGVTWWGIRLVLWAVAAGAVWLTVTVWHLGSPRSGLWLVAFIGMLLFTFHTAVLDATIWPAKFPRLHQGESVVR